MELRQLRSLVTLVDVGFNVSRTAKALHLVQSAVSQHIARLEAELGTSLLIRHGKRITGLSGSGEKVVHQARQMLAAADNIVSLGKEHVSEEEGVLRLGTTHTQAMYILPPVLREFRRQFPKMEVQIHQATPPELGTLAESESVDLAICTESLADNSMLTTIPCYRWNRSVVAPKGHPVLAQQPLSLGDLCNYPLVTYVFGFTGASRFRDTFARHGLHPKVTISAADTDVIKTYVRESWGVGIIASMAYSPELDQDLGVRDVSLLFPAEDARIAHRKDKFLRGFEEAFIELFRQLSPRYAGY